MNLHGPEIQEVLLQRLKVGATHRLSPSVLHSMRLETWRDEVTDALVVALRAYVLAEHLDQHTETRSTTITIDRPDGWWQHWKADHYDAAGWAIRWVARRTPVRVKTEHRTVTLSATWDRYAAFPEATIVVPDDRLGAPLRWLTSGSEIRWDR